MSELRHGVFSVGGDLVYLAGLTTAIAHVNAPADYSSGEISDFDTLLHKDVKMQEWAACHNKVKKCPTCSKSVAFSMSNCNKCTRTLHDVSVSFIPNVFIGFMFGVRKITAPLTISLREQNESYLVFDDAMSIAVCHLNAIPTSAYIPDVRYLFSRPTDGKIILQNLLSRCWLVVENQFDVNEEFKTQLFRGKQSLKQKDFQTHAMIGFNYPPSQYQLHLQFMLPPFYPKHFKMYLEARHFTKGRFIPLEYVQAVLALDIAFPLNSRSSLEDIFAFYKTQGVDYDAIWSACYQRYGDSHRTLANWDRVEFSYTARSGQLFDKAGHGVEAKEEQMQVADQLLLQNYGRPYVGDKPNGTFYKYPKKRRQDVVDWTEIQTTLPRQKRVSVFLQSLQEFRKYTPQFAYTEWEQFEEYNVDDLKKLGLPTKEAHHLATLLEHLFPVEVQETELSTPKHSPAPEVFDIQCLQRKPIFPELTWSDEVVDAPSHKPDNKSEYSPLSSSAPATLGMLSEEQKSNEINPPLPNPVDLKVSNTIEPPTKVQSTEEQLATPVSSPRSSPLAGEDKPATSSSFNALKVAFSRPTFLSTPKKKATSTSTSPGNTPSTGTTASASTPPSPSAEPCSAFCPIYGVVWAGMRCKTCGCPKKLHALPSLPALAPGAPGWLERIKDLRRSKSGL